MEPTQNTFGAAARARASATGSGPETKRGNGGGKSSACGGCHTVRMSRCVVVNWNGEDLPDQLRQLPAGRYLIASLDETEELSPEQDAGLEAALERPTASAVGRDQTSNGSTDQRTDPALSERMRPFTQGPQAAKAKPKHSLGSGGRIRERRKPVS